MEYSFEPIDINVSQLLNYLKIDIEIWNTYL